ncbi:hypothetical protein [Pasteuria penetrans]|uniref:hypothetical protein n=1 Tax=Pasteuria penetrans TaxID=86005 RepID=UPI000F9D6118|nr:hypothetical protein [Pasteuria penetrans]
MAHRLRDNSRFFWFFSMLLFSVFILAIGAVTFMKEITEPSLERADQRQNPAPLLIHRLGEEDRISPEAQNRS